MKKLNELTIKEAIAGLGSGEFTSVELVSACYEQIARFDSSIRAFVTIVPKAVALAKAQEADDLIIAQGSSAFEAKRLLGIPYSCKDSFSTKGIETTAGSAILKGYVPPYESTVTARLQDAGAILIAKDNMDAFAHGGSTEASDFFVTRNPWDTTRLPGGSSGGTAASVAANFVTFGIGEDTGGSIRCPASWCGITGLKPTYGRVSRYGVMAMASSADCPGPMTKTAEDAALVLDVIAGADLLDAASSPNSKRNFVKSLDSSALKTVSIGYSKSFFGKEMDAGVMQVVKECMNRFKELGAKIVEVDLLDPKYALAVYTIVQRSEVSSNLARFDGIRYGHLRASFGFEARKRMMLGAYALSAGYYDQYYVKAQKVRTLVIENFNDVFSRVNFVVAPTLPSVAQKAGASNKSPLWGELIDKLQLPASMAGLPSLAFPCGFSESLPVGAQLIGPLFSEDKILSAVHMYQQATNHHLKFPDLEETTRK